MYRKKQGINFNKNKRIKLEISNKKGVTKKCEKEVQYK
jgi:hypothetical protein